MILGILIVLVPLLLLYLFLRLNRLRFREAGVLDLRVAVALRLFARSRRSELPAAALSLEQRRAQQITDSRRVGGSGGRVDRVRDLGIPGPAGMIPVRHYLPLVRDSGRPLPMVLYFHGGGFVFGSPDSHDSLCRALAKRAGCTVLSVAYRLAPEHPFPAAVEDAYAALLWAGAEAAELGGDPDRLAVAGDSAGGNLAAVLCLKSRDEQGPAIGHQALIYPATDATNLERESHRLYAEGYFLELAEVVWFLDQYLPRREDRGRPYASPLLAPNLAGLPPATVVTAEFDLLRDEGEAYAEALRRAGVPVHSLYYPGVVHGFASALRFLPKARQAVRSIAGDLRHSWGEPDTPFGPANSP